MAQKLLVLMRGLPGSGKSHYARSNFPYAIILSTDEYFTVCGQYFFDPQQLGLAHEWNQWRAQKVMEAEHSVVVIDNTNTRQWEMAAYKKLAQKYGYEVEIHKSDASWRDDPIACHQKQTHGVPLEVIQNMVERWED